MSCACPRSPKGLSPSAHLADGTTDLILVRKCSRLDFFRHLLRHINKDDQVGIKKLPLNDIILAVFWFNFRELSKVLPNGNITQFMFFFCMKQSRCEDYFRIVMSWENRCDLDPAGMRKTSPPKYSKTWQFHPSQNTVRQSLCSRIQLSTPGGCSMCAQINRECVKSANKRTGGRVSPLAVLAPPFADSAQFHNYGSL